MEPEAHRGQGESAKGSFTALAMKLGIGRGWRVAMPAVAAPGDVLEEHLSFAETSQAASGLPEILQGQGDQSEAALATARLRQIIIGRGRPTFSPEPAAPGGGWIEDSSVKDNVVNTTMTKFEVADGFSSSLRRDECHKEQHHDSKGEIDVASYGMSSGIGMLPPKRGTLLQKATKDPNKLTKAEISEAARTVVEMAVKHKGGAEPAAHFCGAMLEKARSTDFAYCLLDWCMAWYVRRDELLPRRILQVEEHVQGIATPSRYHWTSFVGFLAELLKVFEGGGRSSAGQALDSTTPSFRIASMFCACSEVMLCWPAEDSLREVMCLGASLMSSGKLLELVAPDQMNALHDSLQSASCDPKFPLETRQRLLELTELRSSGWEHSAT